MDMHRHPRLLEVVSTLLVLVLLTNGCTMTRELWTDRLYHPHAKPQLQLAASPERPLVLVAYREQFEKTQHVRWRAFWLDLADRYEPYVKPNFVDPADYPGLIQIPVIPVTQGTNSLPSTGYAAMATANKPGFELWRDGQALGRFYLPSYEGDAPITTETVAKTPLTLLADGVVITVVVVVVVAILAAYGAAEAND
jgi:hypothetical protein